MDPWSRTTTSHIIEVDKSETLLRQQSIDKIMYKTSQNSQGGDEKIIIV